MAEDKNTLFELARKYNRPGPRYTSYPTALQFTDKADFSFLQNDAATATEPLSIYIHLPFCASLCWFCGCTNEVTTDSARAERYLDYLEREILLYKAARTAPLPSVAQLHYGGGTPNFLSAAQLERLGNFLRAQFNFSSDAECSVELDPRTLSLKQVEALAKTGMTRASIGIQDCDAAVQQAVHRVQPMALNEQAFQWLRANGFTTINVDLMYGLPLQNASSWARTLASVSALKPDRLAVFNYAHVPWMRPAQKILEKHPLPAADEKIAMLLEAIGHFEAGGFSYVGMDHFARPSDPLFVARQQGTLRRNFQGYSTHAGTQIAGFGISSISQTPRSYRQNHKPLARYESLIEEGRAPLERGYVLTEDDKRRGEAIMQLMCNFKLPAQMLDGFDGMKEKLKSFEADGLIEWKDGALLVTQLGRLFVRNIAMNFDAYLNSDEQRFSKTV